MTVEGLKHLVQCRCILPQFKRLSNPPFHQFVVFSVIDDEKVRVKFAQCDNCGLIHRVVDIAKSEIMKGREYMSSLITVDEIKMSLGDAIVAALEANDVDRSTWEMVKFIVDNEKWGEHVILSRETEGSDVHVKYMRIIGANMIKVDTEMLQAYVQKE